MRIVVAQKKTMENKIKEIVSQYNSTGLAELMTMAHNKRLEIKDLDRAVSYQIDRNINTTNVCCSGCKFCTFHCRKSEKNRAYITTIEEYCTKIEELYTAGGRQILLQGGMHPDLGIEYYESLFGQLQHLYPDLILHALGAPEIVYLAKKAGIGVQQAIERLVAAGLSSIPGAGAEILNTEWRRLNSPAKCSAEEWLHTMETAHKMGLKSSATMMYGFRDTLELRIEHLLKIRELQERTGGFTSFIAWPYRGVEETWNPTEYLKTIAISRLVLTNIENIQASWLTVGLECGMMALHGGANDMGSILLEENVVRSAGIEFSMSEETMREVIQSAGFRPVLRNQLFEYL